MSDPISAQHQVVETIRDESWALHREHMRAGRVFVLHGPDPKDIFPAPSWEEIDVALQRELNYVKNHLQYTDYCTLNLCRIMYSYETRDVVTSKRASAKWAIDKYPQWRSLIDAAVRSYDDQFAHEDREDLRSELINFLNFACERI